MKKIAFVLMFLSYLPIYSQNINFGLSFGPNISSQTLRSANSPYSAGVKFNTIGGIPYNVDPYIGFNAGLSVELLFDISSSEEINSKIGLKSGIYYSSQGVTVEDVNNTTFENSITYFQIPILFEYKIQKFSFFLGPQLHFLEDFKTIETRSSNLSSNATAQNPDFKFDKNYYIKNDPNFAFGFGYEVYKGLSFQFKSLKSLKNICNISDEEWKNIAKEITFNFNINSLL